VALAIGLASVALAGLGGCESGSVALSFEMPSDSTLVPTAPATVTLVAEIPGEGRRKETHEVDDDGHVELGEIAVADGVRLSVELRSATQRLLGFGRSEVIEVLPQEVVEVPVRVRRPFAYTGGAPGAIATFDPTVDPAERDFKGKVAMDRTPTVVVGTPDGATMAVASAVGNGGELRLLSTSTHAVTGAVVTLQAPPVDAAVSPDGRYVVISHDGPNGGVSVVDLEAAAAGETTASFEDVGNVSALATATREDGGTAVYALIDGADVDSCNSGATSKILVLALGASNETAALIDYGSPLPDIAAIGADDPDGAGEPALFVADPCIGAIVRVNPSSPEQRQTLAGAPKMTTVAVLDGRVWGVGSQTPSPQQELGARLVLVSDGYFGGAPTMVELPEGEESAVSVDFSGSGQRAVQQLDADRIRARDLAVLPGSEQLALLVQADFDGAETGNIFGQPIIPRMEMTTIEYVLVSSASGTYAQRARTYCDLAWESNPLNPPVLDNFECTQAPGQDVTSVEFVPGTLTVLYGAR
jgi:hypothetical protein